MRPSSSRLGPAQPPRAGQFTRARSCTLSGTVTSTFIPISTVCGHHAPCGRAGAQSALLLWGCAPTWSAQRWAAGRDGRRIRAKISRASHVAPILDDRRPRAFISRARLSAGGVPTDAGRPLEPSQAASAPPRRRHGPLRGPARAGVTGDPACAKGLNLLYN